MEHPYFCKESTPPDYFSVFAETGVYGWRIGSWDISSFRCADLNSKVRRKLVHKRVLWGSPKILIFGENA